jgi:hypothetical protein
MHEVQLRQVCAENTVHVNTQKRACECELRDACAADNAQPTRTVHAHWR